MTASAATRKALTTGRPDGLTEAEATRRLAAAGPNEGDARLGVRPRHGQDRHPDGGTHGRPARLDP
ncbi:cation-transporting P-type ATPase [Streptomyces sp. SP18ES09]|uniref:cation-transporting P-type ATPase n=1 Tax=Streptomyces sp. SP18ES09 TaxID=3002532 RepID=UPI003FCEB368